MGKLLGSDPNNIRYYGTGRAFFKPAGESGYHDMGSMDSLSLTQSVTTESLYDTRTAARAEVKKRETERSASVAISLREWTEQNLLTAFLGSAFNDNNQAAGYQDLAETTVVEDAFVDLSKQDVSLLKLSHGAVTDGPFQVGETLTGGTSSATGVVVWVGSGFVELVNISGAFQAGETVTGGTSSGTASVSGTETSADVCVVDAASPTTRYVQGTDYKLDADAGMLMVLSAGSISGSPYVAFNNGALSIRKAYMFSGSSRQGEFLFVSDADDDGPRVRIRVHKMQFIADGDTPLMGDGVSALPLTGTILADTSQPSGQEYWSIEEMAAA